MSATLSIAILTTARSDFGPLKRVIRHAAERFHVDLLIAGSHFLASRGSTVQEIEEELRCLPDVNLVLFDAMVDGSSPEDQVQTLASTQLKASAWFARNEYDALLFLGDRWELWGVTLPAFLHGIPLAHISGGEVTEGVIDENVRHAHTKMAGLHFVAAEEYARNVSLMGEEDWRICVSGECGLDLIHNAEMASELEVKERFGVDLGRKTILVTFHPSTLDYQVPVGEQIGSLLGALEGFPGHQIVFTAPGVECGAEVVISSIRRFVAGHENALLVEHFGSRNYLAVMSRAGVVVGNSSSGLVEAASFGVPAVNIGNRQKSRLASESVQHVPYDERAITEAIEHVLSDDFQAYARTCRNPYDPYGDGRNSMRIVQGLASALSTCTREQLRLKKFDNVVREDEWNKLLQAE